MGIFRKLQLATMANSEQRQAMMKQISAQCKANESYYDGSIAVGLIAAARKTSEGCAIEPVIVFGCNRQVSKHGQTRYSINLSQIKSGVWMTIQKVVIP